MVEAGEQKICWLSQDQLSHFLLDQPPEIPQGQLYISNSIDLERVVNPAPDTDS